MPVALYRKDGSGLFTLLYWARGSTSLPVVSTEHNTNSFCGLSSSLSLNVLCAAAFCCTGSELFHSTVLISGHRGVQTEQVRSHSQLEVFHSLTFVGFTVVFIHLKSVLVSKTMFIETTVLVKVTALVEVHWCNSPLFT